MTEKDEKAPLTPEVPGLKSAASARYRALLAEERESRRAGTRRVVEETVVVPTTQQSPVTLTVVAVREGKCDKTPGGMLCFPLPFGTGSLSRTLLYHKDLTVVLTVMKAGAMLHEHQAPASVTLLPLFGEIVLSAAEGQTALPLTPGTGAVFAAHLTHRVEARQDSAFVLVMGGQA